MIAALAAIAVVVVAIVVIDSSGGGGSPSAEASTSTHTATITRRDLVEIDTEDGTLGYAGTRSVVNHLSGTVTWIAAQGSVVEPGHSLYRVDTSPVVLMSGTRPAYRNLQSGVSSGADVRQLERNLRVLGYDPDHAMPLDSTWTAATTSAVDRFQAAHGLTQTGSLELGRIVFQPGARRVATISATLGGSASGGGSATGSTSASGAAYRPSSGEQANAVNAVLLSRTPVGRVEIAAHAAQDTTTPTTTTPTTTTPTTTTPTMTTPTTTTTTPTTPATPAPAPKKKASKPSVQRTTPATTQGGSFGGGAGGTGASAAAAGGAASGSASAAASGTASNTIMTTTSTRRVVTVQLDTSKSEIAHVGDRVTVQLPSGNFAHGRITSVGTVATSTASSSSSSSGGSSGSSSNGSATVTVTIHLTSTGGTLDQAPVSVRFQESRVRNVLAIPVTALLAQSGGRYAVQVVESSGIRLVPVTPGLYTSGYVQIDGAGLKPGMRVTNAGL